MLRLYLETCASAPYNMTVSVVQIMAYIHTIMTKCILFLHACRRSVLPHFLKGGRDMKLLTNGSWVESTVHVPDCQIAWRYDSQRHHLHHVDHGSDSGLARHGWISVVHADRDMSEFFSGLRHTRGQTPTNDSLLMLYAHQMGWCPFGSLQIMNRSGDEHVLDISETFPATKVVKKKERESPTLHAIQSSANLDYIR